MNVGIVGAGAIGGFLIRELNSDIHFTISAVAEIDPEQAKKVLTGVGLPENLIMNMVEFPQDTDIYVESAARSAARPVAEFALSRGKIAVIASIGGLGDIDDLREIAEKKGGKLILPSGAIAGLDALKAIPPASIETVVLKSIKPATTLADMQYLVDRGINCLDLKKPTVVFSGTAREACEAFPRSANVSAALAHASIGLDRVQVEMWADPEGDRNRHSITVESGHGVFELSVSNVPFEINPRTSRLAAYSILATIRGLADPVVVGT